MAPSAEPYRKLPGRLRGFGYGATVWIGSDHLLLARTSMFRETYQRFYLRDVQAIVVARRPRFHFSIRAAVIGALWAFEGLFLTVAPGYFLAVYLAVFAALIVAWIIVSSAFSCTCRLSTAVSNVELPSLYRIWTARQFLAEVKPRIEEAQGVLDSHWSESLESRPPELVPVTAAGQPTPPPAPSEGALHNAVSDAFIASLLMGAILDLLTLRSVTNAVRWSDAVLALIQVSFAVFVLIQCHRRILRPPMQKLALAALILMGAGFYASTLLTAVSGTAAPALAGATLMLPQFVLLRVVYSSLAILLGFIGVIVILRGRAARQPDIINS
jgi:hypothetical protein